jgi:hypothetical protein
VRTLELVYWTIGIMIAVCVAVAAPAITTHWIKASAIPTDTVQRAVRMMGLLSCPAVASRFYQSGLIGLERQVPLNGLRMGMAHWEVVGRSSCFG